MIVAGGIPYTAVGTGVEELIVFSGKEHKTGTVHQVEACASDATKEF